MVNETCSNSMDPHSVVSDLHKLIESIDQFSTSDDTKQELGADLGDKLKREVDHIQASLNKLSAFMADLGKRVQPLVGQIKDGGIEGKDPVFISSLRELSSAVTHLKFQLPFTPYYTFLPQDPPATSCESTAGSSPAPMADRYENLNHVEKQCLWCFSAFPEGARIKKRVLINWWIGEGFLDDDDDNSSARKLEQKGETMLQLLKDKKFIEPVLIKGRSSDTWWMEPSVRSFMDTIDQDGNNKILLLKSQRGKQHYELREDNPVETIFNINGSGTNAVKAGSPHTMTCLRVLHLGRSTISGPKQHVQVEGSDLMEGLGEMKNLRLLSLQGISSLTKLPKSVCALKSLMVLDLRACQALESLPSKIGSVKTLTHLDLSECFTRQRLPKAISELSSLEVLKGFVVAVGHSDKGSVLRRRRTCTLHDLRKLKKLRTLSVLVVRGSFPRRKDLKDLGRLEELAKLKIVWLTGQDDEPCRGEESINSCKREVMMMGKLEKLDLWRVPEEAAPLLLNPGRYPVLKKLYIRGSLKLQDINGDGADSEQKWTRVSTLRLIGLPCLKAREDLRSMFPELSYLEKSECPNLQFPDCNEEGVWTI